MACVFHGSTVHPLKLMNLLKILGKAWISAIITLVSDISGLLLIPPWLVHNSLVEEILRHVPYSHNLEITNQLLFMHLVKSCELTYCTIVSSWVTSSSPSSEHVFIWAQKLAFGTTACGDVSATSWEPLLYYALPPNYLQTCYLNHHLIHYPIVTATRTCYLKKHPIHYPIVTATGRTSSFFKLEECPGEFSSLFVL